MLQYHVSKRYWLAVAFEEVSCRNAFIRWVGSGLDAAVRSSGARVSSKVDSSRCRLGQLEVGEIRFHHAAAAPVKEETPNKLLSHSEVRVTPSKTSGKSDSMGWARP